MLRRRVIKIGGSLLSCPDIGERFANWLQGQHEAQNFLIVGGGDAVESMRHLDAVHHFAQAEVHWWCVSLLSTTAKVAARLLDVGIIDSPDALERCLAHTPTSESLVVDVNTFYTPGSAGLRSPLRGVSGRLDELPESWKTTTDSISAYFTVQTQISELVLLKSISAADDDMDSWSREGVVDEFFPDVARQIASVRLVNLREFPRQS
ncbi:MAG: hypothetical protein ACE361_10815 [Aureliella sp.]